MSIIWIYIVSCVCSVSLLHGCTAGSSPWFKVIGVWESKQFWAIYLTKLSVDLNEIWSAVETWCNESHTHFSWFFWYSRERTLHKRSRSKNVCIGFYSNIWRLISFKLYMMIETIELCILISVWMTLTFIQDHSCMRNKKCWCPFSRKFVCPFGLNSVCCHNLLVYWSSCLIGFAKVLFKGENSAGMIVMKYMFNIIMCHDTCELICLKLGMMLNITWCSLRVTGLWES